MKSFKSAINILKRAVRHTYDRDENIPHDHDEESMPWYKNNEPYAPNRGHNADPLEDAEERDLQTEFGGSAHSGMHHEKYPEFFESKEDAFDFIKNKLDEGTDPDDATLLREGYIAHKIGNHGWLIGAKFLYENEFIDAYGKHWSIDESDSKDYDFMLMNKKDDHTPDFDALDASAALYFATKFCKFAVVSHYSQISDLHNASQSLSNATSKNNDALVKKYVGDIKNSANRLLFNADNFGVTSQTSAKYHGAIQNALDQLKEYTASVGDNTIAAPIGALQSSLSSYIPESISAQKPSPMPGQTPAKYGPDPSYTSLLPGDKSNPFIPARSPGPGYEVPSALNVVNLPEQKVFPSKPGPETVPGPNGWRIPAVPYTAQENGISHESFNFPMNTKGPARLAPETKLPLNPLEQEKAKWNLPQDANDGSVQAFRLDTWRKIAKL